MTANKLIKILQNLSEEERECQVRIWSETHRTVLYPYDEKDLIEIGTDYPEGKILFINTIR